MKQLLLLSGKGGTGKTTLAGAFIRFAQAEACCDCDVDAPNLHLILWPEGEPRRSVYYGLPKAYIDPDLCTSCGLCRYHCRFQAVSLHEGYRVDPLACEGCGVCHYVCPAGAIAMEKVPAGERRLYAKSRVFSTARLFVGNGSSGLLVTEVKKDMRDASQAPFAVLDGSPGIGCPVIASLSGVDYVLIVAEPSVSGISDMKRILKTAALQGVEAGVCVNKYDIHLENTRAIEQFCEENAIAFLGRIPFDPLALEAVNHGRTIADISCPSGQAAERVYHQIRDWMKEKKETR